MTEEYFDICNENGEPTGKIISRSEAHRTGTPHRTSHVWILNDNRLLLQKRSHDKDSYPDCYDISSAGHIPAGSGFVESALRELREELGLAAEETDLQLIGHRYGSSEHIFHGEIFRNTEYSAVFLYTKPVDINKLTIQTSEISEVIWQDFYEVLKNTENSSPDYCIHRDELIMIREHYCSL